MPGVQKKQKTCSEGGASNPWDEWPHELPTQNEPVPECKHYAFLEDDKFVREMNAEIRSLAMSRCKATFPTIEGAAVLLAGGTSRSFSLYDSDTTKCPFRQEAYFRYIFSTNEPDCFGALDLTKGQSLLFVPYVTDDSQRWNGTRRPLTYYKEKYGVDEVHLVEDMENVLKERGLLHLYTLYGENTDSGEYTDTRSIDELKGVQDATFTVDKKLLHPLLCEMRVFKTDKEIEYLKMSALVSSQAHVYVMRHIKPGMTELQLEALFKAWTCFYGASRHVAYTCICGCGPNGSVLHYGHASRPNDCIIHDGDMALLDMGAEYRGYATDITCAIPANGKFTADQRAIYNAVRAAQEAVFQALKPGVSFADMHRLAERTILTHLLKLGVLQGDVEGMITNHLGAVFMPHGLGHFIGLNCHDVGGFPVGGGNERCKEPGVCYLRTTRKLEKGMCLTVEPGCYFGDPVLDKALANPAQSQFINQDVLQRFRGFGGVRLEDDVVITATGMENMTVLPNTVEKIEAVMKKA